MTKDECNKRLLELYGRHVLADVPIFRVVFSDDELEYRKGLFGPLMVFPEVRLVPKYNYLKATYVLEKYTEIGVKPEIMNVSGYSYEPIWAFRDRNNNPLPLMWEAVEALIHGLMNVVIQRRTEEMDRTVYEEEKEKEYQRNMEILDDAMRSYSTENINRETI